MRVPKNKITYGKTVGKEYVYEVSGNYYVGPFYKINGIYYAGEAYNPDIRAFKLLPVKKKAIDNPNGFLYNVLAGAKEGLKATSVSSRPTKSQNLASIAAANQQGFVPVVGVNLDADTEAIQTNADQVQASSTPQNVKRYFYRKKISSVPLRYKIAETNEDEYNKLKSQPPILYVTTFVTETRIEGFPSEFNPDELDRAEKRIPGLKKFLGIEVEE
jgi:hypothetical protein